MDAVGVTMVVAKAVALDARKSLTMDAITESAAVFKFALKEKQIEAISSFIEGNDTFVSLPTGYGKSVIYAILPSVFDKLRGRFHYLCSYS